MPSINLRFCAKLACDSSNAYLSSFSPILFDFLKISYFEVLRSVLLFLIHCTDDCSLHLQPISCPWVIEYFSSNVGLPGHFINWHTLIGLNWKLKGTPSIY